MKNVIYVVIRNVISAYSKASALFAGLFLFLGSVPAAINITNMSFSADIVGVSYREDGSLVTQNSPATGENADSTTVDLIEIEIALAGGGTTTLDQFNTGVVSAVALNFPATEDGFEAFVGNQVIGTSDISSFQDALREVYSNTSLRDYVNKSQNANANNPDGDYDIFYQYALSPEDYIVVAERDGNSEIQLQALDMNGNPVSGAETLVFQGGTNSAYTWDTGYRSALDTNSGQTLALSIVDIGLFGGSEDVFGLRVINNSGADNKIFIASDDTFINNKLNPAVPEPGASGFLLGMLALMFAASRRFV